MKKLLLSLFTMSTLGLMAQVEGTWMLTPKAGSFGVGPSKGDYSWWSVPEAEITGARACQFDDEFVFNADGSFQNVLGEETYVEGWQGSDGCGAPVAPHDGKTAATWSYDETAGTITISGKGAYIGLPKPYNGGELSNPADAPDNITYEVTMTDANNMVVEIKISDAGAYWKYELTRKMDPIDPTGYWQLAPKAYAMAVGPQKGDYSWWGNPAEEVAGARACQFDDYFVFMEDGTFKNILGDETFIEGWQGSDGCGTPVAPHDGSTDGMWSVDAATGTLKIVGKGNYVGIPKVINGAEIKAPAEAADSITYMVSIMEDTMIVEIQISAEGAHWKFELNRVAEPTMSNKAINKGSLNVYPNPVNNTLFVNTNTAVNKLTIRDLSGKAVYNQVNPNTEKGLDVSFLNTGAYFISIETANGIENAKFIKQ